MKTYYDIETGIDPTVNPFDFHNRYPDYSEDGLKIGPKDRIPADEKRAKHLAEYEAKRKAHDANVLDRLKLSPATGAIVAIGYGFPGVDEVQIISGDESHILREFWNLHTAMTVDRASSARFLNWTGKNKPDNFDLNFLVRRSWKNDIAPPFINREVFRNVAARFLEWESWQDGHMRLERAALSIGIDVPEFPNVTGATFSEAFLGDDPALVEEATNYLKADVDLLRKIDERISKF